MQSATCRLSDGEAGERSATAGWQEEAMARIEGACLQSIGSIWSGIAHASAESVQADRLSDEARRMWGAFRRLGWEGQARMFWP